jgi:uncharacterized protein
MLIRQIGKTEAQQFQLHCLGLAHAPSKTATRASIARAVSQMGLLQIDTISVVNRSPYLVLYARLGAFDFNWLNDNLKQKKLFEVWAHEACYAPIDQLALLRANLKDRQHWSQRQLAKMRAEQPEAMRQLLRHIEVHGPTRSIDFARASNEVGEAPAKPGWWNWKPEKRQLEAWFAAGELAVTRRESFSRVYDLSSRVFRQLDPSDPQFAAHQLAEQRYANRDIRRQTMALTAARSLGLCKVKWLNDFHRIMPRFTVSELEPLLGLGQLSLIKVEDDPDPWIIHQDHQKLLASVVAKKIGAPTLTVPLSPFDPLVWHRDRAQGLFDFTYRIECYTPAAKRRYGYFVLPLLSRGKLIGRIDAKAHRQDEIFEVKALHFEENVKPCAQVLADIAQSLLSFARWHETPRCVVTAVFNASGRPLKSVKRQLEQAFNQQYKIS